jgi:excisionase family DNA binding protein
MDAIPLPGQSNAPALMLHVKDVAEVLGCSQTFVYKLIREKMISFEKRGRCYRFRREFVEEYRRRNTHEVTGDATGEGAKVPA